VQNDGAFPLGLVADNLVDNPDALVQRVAVGPLDRMRTLAETRGTSGPLRRQMESLLQSTDSAADVTLLVAPSFLFLDGKDLLANHQDTLLPALKGVLGENVQALLVRSHFQPQWYLEWRALGNDLQAASRNAEQWKTMLEQWPDRIETSLVAQPADPYWRAIALRYPQMVRSLAKYARGGSEDGQVILNAYLPPEAFVNLIIGSWMALQRPTSPAVATATAPPTLTPKTSDQWLDTKIRLRIEQDSLENVLQAIATEVKESSGESAEPLPMAIDGTAFQKDGITRNQQIRNFDFQDAPLRQILTDLARRANPVTTVQSAQEPDQKIVWVVQDDPRSSSGKRIELTTRGWADSHRLPLPPEFQLQAK
jgi:hypothetical protein